MSMFSIGLSGLNAAQNALNSTGNNISNVYTSGYNREVAELGEAKAGSGGVKVDNIERQFNRFVADQLNDATSQSSALSKYAEQMNQIDNLLADREAGLSPLMQDFFASLQDLSSAPSDPASRQGVLGTAETLTAQFRSFDSYLQDMQDNVNGELQDQVDFINNATNQIAGLNREIALARASQGEAPNGMLNQRDHLVNQLHERMDIRVSRPDGKSYGIGLPNGQSLVTGKDAFELEVMPSSRDPERMVLGYNDARNGTVELPRDLITGGELGGLLAFRDEALDKTQNQIGQMATSLAMAFNEQHQQGVDLNGDQGKTFFEVRAPQAYSHTGNEAKVASVEFNESAPEALLPTNYTARYNGSDFIVTRDDIDKTVDASWDGETLSFGGVDMTFQQAPEKGDGFEVQPIRRAASEMRLSIAELDEVAAGTFVLDQAGGMDVSDLRVTGSQALANTAEPLELELSGNQLTIDGFSGNVTVNGETRTLDAGVVQNTQGDAAATLADGDEVSIDGISLVIDDAGTDASLAISQGLTGSGDNRNALALQALQSEDIVEGSASLNGAYGAMVSDVGNRTNIVQVNLDARQGLTDQLRAVQQSESGVNLDEEAANLVRYQQYYQANARVIDTATTIMDTILGLSS